MTRARPSRRSSGGLLLACALLAGGCQTPSPQPSTATATPSASAAPSVTPSPSPTRSPSAVAAFDPGAIRVDLEPVTTIPGSPLGVVDPGDGSGRLVVLSQEGQAWIVKDGRRSERPFLDIADRITSGGERGLLGLAFHPDFPGTPLVYTDYTDENGDTVVSAWTVPSGGEQVKAGSEKVILQVEQPFPNHNGGDLHFGPDGFLYVTLGDGGNGGDPQGNGQNRDALLGKILRIDVDHPADGRAYGIPADNPFADGDRGRPEIWVMGVRNPWRTSFDRATGDFWIGDVGQGSYEEIDVVRAGSGGGQNFGWNTTEGLHCFRADSCDQDGLTPPVTEYTHDGNCSVTGGYVYRGAEQTALAGGYFFADYCSGRIWAIDATRDEVREPTLVAATGRSISSFGEDSAGELYVTDHTGALLHLTGSPR